MTEAPDVEKSFFEELTREELVYVAYGLSKECDRLRRELDKINGVIR